MSQPYKIYIKNMVCPRCIAAVTEVLQTKGHQVSHVELGVATLEKKPVENEMKAIEEALIERGFEVIDDGRSKLIEKVRTLVIESIHHQELSEMGKNWSDLISEETGYEYSYVSTLFSSVNGTTLEQYIIQQKIEKVKELLFYHELSVKEIAFRLGYSSVAHLSSQFKKITGMTPSHFRELRKPEHRKAIDTI